MIVFRFSGFAFQSQEGDFLYPNQLYNESVVSKLKAYSSFAGFSLFDSSYEFDNQPCSNLQTRYSQLLYEELRSSAGSATNVESCLVRKNAPTGSSSPKTTQTATQPTSSSGGNQTCTSWWCKGGASSSPSKGSDSGSDDQDPGSPSPGPSGALIGGVVAGVCVAVAGVIGLAYWFRRRKVAVGDDHRADDGEKGAEKPPMGSFAKKSSVTAVPVVNRTNSRLGSSYVG